MNWLRQLWCRLFGCPVPERTIALNVVADTTHALIPDLVGHLYINHQGDPYHGSCPTPGQLIFTIPGDTPVSSIIDLYYTAPGYIQESMSTLLPPPDEDFFYVTLTPDLFPPPPGDPLKVRANFLGDFEEAPPFMLPGMGLGMRQRVYDEARARGETHLVFSISNDYPKFLQWHYDYWENPEAFDSLIQECYSQGFKVLLVCYPRWWRADTIETHLARLEAFIKLIRSEIEIITWGWEINDIPGRWGQGQGQLDYIAGLSTIFGNIPIGCHFTPERWAGWPSFQPDGVDKNEYQWWNAARFINSHVFLAYQDYPDKPIDQVIERAFEISSPFGYPPGIAGRCSGLLVHFVMFEYARDLTRGQLIGERSMEFPTCTGFGNGGPMSDRDAAVMKWFNALRPNRPSPPASETEPGR